MKWLLTETLGGDAIVRYIQWVRRGGVEARLVGSISDIPDDLSPYAALLLTGGGDVNPVRYREARIPETKNIRDDRDALEVRLIQRFLELHKPVFGVCRGIQILNVALGGKLVQHVPEFLALQGSNEEHARAGKRDSRHFLKFLGKSKLREALKKAHKVNSAHHQAVHPDAIGRGLRVVVVSPAGIIEAVEGKALPGPVLAVQWHPERLDRADPASSRLLGLMIDLCSR